jgi:hypothetical protein
MIAAPVAGYFLFYHQVIAIQRQGESSGKLRR